MIDMIKLRMIQVRKVQRHEACYDDGPLITIPK